MSKDFQVSVQQLPQARLYGLKVRTDMTKAQEDCTRIWEEDFCPRMPELSGKTLDECQGESYGLSVVVDMQQGSFDYWAAMPLAEGREAPKDMEQISVPAGYYATCRVNGIGELGAAFTFLYTTWAGGQTEYALNMQAPCFELYGEDYLKNEILDVFVPLVKK